MADIDVLKTILDGLKLDDGYVIEFRETKSRSKKFTVDRIAIVDHSKCRQCNSTGQIASTKSEYKSVGKGIYKLTKEAVTNKCWCCDGAGSYSEDITIIDIRSNMGGRIQGIDIC